MVITIDIFLTGLLIVSTLTGLTTEALKKQLNEDKLNYRTNMLAGTVALVLSIAIGGAYLLVSGVGFTLNSVVCLVALVFMSWLCSMVGYDKVIQTINQLVKKP